MKDKVAVVVDAYSSGNLFAPALRRRGFEVIHVQSTEKIPVSFRDSFHPQDFSRHIVYQPHLNLAADLVIVGCETGVEVADQLIHRLGLPGNRFELSKARRDKYLMIEAVANAGLLTAKQVCSSSESEIRRWVSEYPIVLKPVNSGGTDSVYVCQNEEALSEAFYAIQGRQNRLGIKNETVLAQTYLQGTEFMIDTVSYRGIPVVTEICEYVKGPYNGRDQVYDRIILRNPHDPKFHPMIQYFMAVLKALGIEEGPAHGEIICTAQGPALVEVGARAAGISLPKLIAACGGYDQIEASLDARLDPKTFFLKSKQKQFSRHGEVVFLRSGLEGRLIHPLSLTEFERLGSFLFAKGGIPHGGTLERTVDVFTAPGFVFLAHHRADQVRRDYEVIRALEAGNFYRRRLAC